MDQSESTAANLDRKSRRRWLAHFVRPFGRMASSRRRWLQFSLRGFLAVLTVGCLWLGHSVDLAHREHRAINALEQAGCGILPCYVKRRWPKWANDLVGKDCLKHAWIVEFRRGRYMKAIVSAKELHCLHDLPYLEVVRFIGVQVTDDAAVELARVKALCSVETQDTVLAKSVIRTLEKSFPNTSSTPYGEILYSLPDYGRVRAN